MSGGGGSTAVKVKVALVLVQRTSPIKAGLWLVGVTAQGGVLPEVIIRVFHGVRPCSFVRGSLFTSRTIQGPRFVCFEIQLSDSHLPYYFIIGQLFVYYLVEFQLFWLYNSLFSNDHTHSTGGPPTPPQHLVPPQNTGCRVVLWSFSSPQQITLWG